MFGIGRGAVDLARASARAGVRTSAVNEIRTIMRGLADHAVPSLRPFQSMLDNVPAAGNVTVPVTPRTFRSFGNRLAHSIERA